MTDIKARLNEAADHLDHLYEGSKHIPADLFHDRNFRVGLVRTEQSGSVHHSEVAQFFYGGAAEVFLALGPAVLPILAQWLRTTAQDAFPGDNCTPGTCPVQNALTFADHILNLKETGVSTFDYLTPAEAVAAAQNSAPEYQRIIGLKGVDADRIPNVIPEEPWRAHGHLDKFKEIARVEWAQDADPGTAEVFYADGSTDLIKRGDLLCVERPITA